MSHLALRDVARQVGDGVGDVVVRHRKDGQLGDGPIAAVHATSALVDGGQIGVHVPGVTTSTGHFFTGGGHLVVMDGGTRGQIEGEDKRKIKKIRGSELECFHCHQREEDDRQRRGYENTRAEGATAPAGREVWTKKRSLAPFYRGSE